jgi:hypothetical protein
MKMSVKLSGSDSDPVILSRRGERMAQHPFARALPFFIMSQPFQTILPSFAVDLV